MLTHVDPPLPASHGEFAVSHALPLPMLTRTPNVNQVFLKKDWDISVSRMHSTILFHIILFWCTVRIIREE